jgi:hypothetical protein
VQSFRAKDGLHKAKLIFSDAIRLDLVVVVYEMLPKFYTICDLTFFPFLEHSLGAKACLHSRERDSVLSLLLIDEMLPFGSLLLGLKCA